MLQSNLSTPKCINQNLAKKQDIKRKISIIFIPSLVIAAFTAISFVSWAQPSPPSIPSIPLATQPLYASAAVDKPTMALALSVEFPTVGAQYLATANATEDVSYSPNNEYLGYYDAEGCYTYNNTPSEKVTPGKTLSDYKRFTRIVSATNRRCADAFSGNFLNWSSSSAIDMLRLSLSGGDRYIDENNLTILQRAVIPNGDPICMWNSANFPGKKLIRENGSYQGAVPLKMRSAAGSKDIWVANTLNRIYFGQSKSGSCTDTSSYSLSAQTAQIGTITSKSGALPTGAINCASENGTCTVPGIKEVWYGAGTSWKVAPVSISTACTNAVFGDPISGTAKLCYYTNNTVTWQPSTFTNALNSDGFFYARVEVCNSSGNTLQDSRDYNLCKQYPSGYFKPTGAIQKYSDQLRLAAFGYVMEQTASYSNNNTGRYGGVLRAPMKYVGPKTYNNYGEENTPSGGNPEAEWNSNTGVFFENSSPAPVQHPSALIDPTPYIPQVYKASGVINYLNRFGRTGATPGLYKQYDPVGELYYQTLRYLQGLPATEEAVKGITTSMLDGFPVYKYWDKDPYAGRSDTADYSCLKSNIVVIGDINTHDGNWRYIPNNNDSISSNVPNFRTWHSIVQSFEKNQNTDYVDGQGDARTTGNPNGVNNSVPSSTQTSQIMGYAYWAHTHDIRGSQWTSDAAETAKLSKRRPGLRVKTFVFDVNENGTQTNTSTRRSSNQFFMAAKYGGFESDPSNAATRPYNTWGNPFKDKKNATNNNIWQKSDQEGEAATYYLQSNAREVLKAFDEIFSSAVTTSRNIAGISASRQSISSTNGSIIYSASFNTSNWSGEVIAEKIEFNSAGQTQASAPIWSAANQLDNMPGASANRKIFIGKGTHTSQPAATAFEWSELPVSIREHLSKITQTSTADTLGADRVAYLRGDKTKEGKPFRVRSSLLGDIVNSNVVFSGAPSNAHSGTGYKAFRETYLNRTHVVFAGANDGMLHAFDANNGNEIFSYIPSWLAPKLAALTEPNFIANHQNYVDAPLAIAEAQVANTGQSSDWKTFLVGGTGGGGSGIFALDVSNPSTFGANKLAWEFTRNDDSDIGQIIGQPNIIKLKTSAAGTPDTYRWFVAVGSGVNNYVPESVGGPFSATGNATLFLLALDKPSNTSWSLGTNYFKISFRSPNPSLASTPNGLVNFSHLTDTSGSTIFIYAGDLHGNLWKLNFKNKTPENWNIDKLSFFNKGTIAEPRPYPLYIAKDSSGGMQYISAAPAIFPGGIVQGIETYYIAFGTGKFLESSDKVSTSTNTFYVIYDSGSTSGDMTSNVDAGAILGRNRLAQAIFNSSTRTFSVGTSFKWGRPTTDSNTQVRAGWYADLPSTGEKLVSTIANGGSYLAAFNTVIPSSAGAILGSCLNNQSSGQSYVVSITSGKGSYSQPGLGVLAAPLLLDDEDATKKTYTTTDSSGRRYRTQKSISITAGQSGLSQTSVTPDIKEVFGRLSWRYVESYQDMKNKP